MNVSNDDIKHEAEIVWLFDPESMPYVRERVTIVSTRQRPIKKYNDYKVVGYAILKPDAPGKRMFRRRFFWLKDYDRYYQPQGIYSIGTPVEGVDPLTVAPGVAGQQTDRSWGVPYR